MKFRSLITAGLALFLCSSTAFAQDADKGSDKVAPEKYVGETFEILPPSGWILVAGTLSESERNKLPENVREHYAMRNTDILFLNLSSQDAECKGFKDSLNIVTVTEAIPLTKELVQELSSVLKQQYDMMFEKFEMENIEVTKLGARDVLAIKGSYQLNDYKIKLEQLLVPSEKDSLVLTCTYDSGKENADDVIDACRNAMNSINLLPSK